MLINIWNYSKANKPITAATAGDKNPVPATKEAATRVEPPVTTSIALTEMWMLIRMQILLQKVTQF